MEANRTGQEEAGRQERVKGRISLLLLTYRRFDGVFTSLDSIFMQDYPDIEIILSDDGSPGWEAFLPELRSYVERHRGENIRRVEYHHLAENQGTVRNENAALGLTRGEYIKDMAPEDRLAVPDALTRYVRFLEECGCLICFSRQEGVTETGEIVRHLASSAEDYHVLRTLTPLQLRNRLFSRNCLPAPAWFARWELYALHGLYLPVTRIIEDYPYWIHLCTRQVKIGFTDDVLVRYSLSNSGAGCYSPAFMRDMFAIYEQCIFPLDRRFGPLQPLYNRLKRAGLNAYMDRACWEDYSRPRRLLAWLRHGAFFLFIRFGEWRMRRLNAREKIGSGSRQ